MAGNSTRPKIRFKGFTDDWELFELGSVTKSYSGGTPLVGNNEYYGGNIPFIRSGEINSNSTEIYITEEGLNKSSAKMVNRGSILYALYGATSGEVGISKINGAINQAILALIPNEGYNEEFITQWLSINKKNIINKYLQGGQGNLSANIVKSLNIDFPDSIEQSKIGDFFKDIDSLINLQQLKYDKLVNIKKAMLEKMFPKNGSKVPEIRFKGFTEDWNLYKLQEVATMKARIGWQGLTQKEFLDEGDYYLITGTDFDKGIIDFKNCHFIGEDRYNQDINIQIKNDDVLITKDGTIGKVAYVENMDKPATLSAGVFVIRGKNKDICNLYLYHYLAAPFLLDYADKQATGGTIKHLNQNVLVNFPVPMPKIEEQQKIGAFFKDLDGLIALHQRKYDKLIK